MALSGIPANLDSLHEAEEGLRSKALELIAADQGLPLHLAVIENAMDLCDLFRQIVTDYEDEKAVQLLSMRVFNAFGASLKLALSGYSQNSALIMRDILETVFLVGMFRRDRTAIKRWREASSNRAKDEFRPVKVRKFLDDHDGFTTQRREKIYKMFSELAGHPSMQSMHMMRPVKGGDSVIGPFMEFSTLQAVLSEMGRLAVQVGEVVDSFFPADFDQATSSRAAFAEHKAQWIKTFYS